MRLQQQSGAFLDRLVSAVAALPGVESAAAVNTLPLTGFNALRPHNLPGQPPQTRPAEFRIVTPVDFRTWRSRSAGDAPSTNAYGPDRPAVIVVNEAAARRLWPSGRSGRRDADGAGLWKFSPRQVIGVVGDTRHHDLAKDPEARFTGRPRRVLALLRPGVRTQSTAEGLERTLATAAGRVDSTVPISAVQSLGSARRLHVGVAPLEHGIARVFRRPCLRPRVRGRIRRDGVRGYRAIAGDRRAGRARRKASRRGLTILSRPPGSRAPAAVSGSRSPRWPEEP